MDIIYSGIHLSMGTTEEFSLEPVYDTSQTDYLFTRFRVVGSAVINGQVEVREVSGPPVSYKRDGEKAAVANATGEWIAGKPPGTPDAINRGDVDIAEHSAGVRADPLHARRRGIYARKTTDYKFLHLTPAANPAPLTHQAVRQRLMMPRAPLYVFAGTGDPTVGQLLLKSPTGPKRHTDAMNGPKPLLFEMQAALGEGDTFLVRYGIETYVNEAGENGIPNFNSLLSNRFSMRHRANEDGINWIEVKGEAYFRTDLMYGEGFPGPDEFRNRLFLPVPFGYVREEVVVEGLPGANGVSYSFRDRLQAVHFPAGPFVGATRIEASHTQTVFTDTDLLLATCDLVGKSTDVILNNAWLAKAAKEKAPAPVKDEDLPSRIKVSGRR